MHVRVCEQVMWNYMLTLSTFILTFFLKECYDYWGTVMDLSRKIQGAFPISLFVEREKRVGGGTGPRRDHSRGRVGAHMIAGT